VVVENIIAIDSFSRLHGCTFPVWICSILKVVERDEVGKDIMSDRHRLDEK